jgi:hypothetical protein
MAMGKRKRRAKLPSMSRGPYPLKRDRPTWNAKAREAREGSFVQGISCVLCVLLRSKRRDHAEARR